MRYFLIHGTGGNPDETFYPYLKKNLKGEVIAPRFPPPEKQSLQSWSDAFKPYEKLIDEETVFIGRSLAPAFILRVLERIDKKVKACFFVCGFCSDIGLDDFRPLIKTFVGEFDWEKIKKNCGKFFVYNSDNDPYVKLEKGKELADKLGTKLIVVKGAEHFWMAEFPQLLEDMKSI
jgi:uncharacterized protein